MKDNTCPDRSPSDIMSLPAGALTEDRWLQGFPGLLEDRISESLSTTRDLGAEQQTWAQSTRARSLYSFPYHFRSQLKQELSQQRHLKPTLPPNPGKGPSPPHRGQCRAVGQTGAQHQGQDSRPEGASTCKVRSQCHLISEQVSLSYEMSLQFALAPLGGGFLKQRDRLRGKGG